MSHSDAEGLSPHDRESIDLDQRDVRALTEPMSVLPNTGRASGADDLFLVVSASGSEYLVDARQNRCECPDARHRDPEGGCKHQRRVAYVTGERPIPLWCNADAIDPQLGAHVDATPIVAATDGGARADATDRAADESAVTDDDDGRPGDCSCLPQMEELPCFACWLAGHKMSADVEETED